MGSDGNKKIIKSKQSSGGGFGKIAVIALVALAAAAFFKMGLHHELSFESIKERQAEFQALYAQKPMLVACSFFLLYVVVAALSLPGAALLTLLGGALFGLYKGLLLVSFASSIGATLSFLASRFLFQDFVKNKFSEQYKKINAGIEKEGAFYLFTLRLIPVVPFFVINLGMGLTKMKTVVFYLVSQLGMLAGTAAFVNAGTQLSQIDSMAGIISPKVLLSFAILGVLPLILKFIINSRQQKKAYKGFKKPKKFDYNMVVIGAGSGGLVTAYIAAAVKAKVALIEKHKMGGDCLNTGCVPSKALIRSAKFAKDVQVSKKYGFKLAAQENDFSAIMERVQGAVKAIEPHDSVERYSSLGVEVLQGHPAKMLSPWEVEVNGKILTTKNIVIASGARPFIPPIPGLDAVKPLHSDNLWEIREQPKRLLVLGGGPIGSEMAQSFARLGCEVTQVEANDRIMRMEDTDVSDLITKKFEDDGIKVLTNHKAKEFKIEGGVKKVICDSPNGDVTIEFDEVLMAIGRRANVDGFGLKEVGVELTPRGTVKVDEYLRTNFHNIFAVGDVAGPYQFTHTASHQAWYAAVNGLFGKFKKFKADYRVIPWCTYVDPEVARVGINEQEAEAQGIDYEVTKYEMHELDRAITDSATDGFIKVITPPGKDKILGVTIVGSRAGDLLAEYVLAMKYNLGLNKILGTIHTYPTYAEANKYVAGNWKRANKPDKLLGYVEKLHKFMR